MRPPNKRRMVKINRFTQARLIALLLEGIYTCQELAEETGLHYVTVLDYTRELYRAKAAFIKAWEPDSRGRYMIKVYQIGVGKDARKPKKTSAQRTEAHRAKKKAHAALTAVVARPAPEYSDELEAGAPS